MLWGTPGKLALPFPRVGEGRCTSDPARKHHETSLAGGSGRLWKRTFFHQSLSACQWISASTRREPKGRRKAEARMPELVRATRGPIRLVKSPPPGVE
jgi:hypothetical protein